MLSPNSVNDILKAKRKGRRIKPCYPCRQRKVKCDESRPCKRCVERAHADLCSYEPGLINNNESRRRLRSKLQTPHSTQRSHKKTPIQSDAAHEQVQAESGVVGAGEGPTPASNIFLGEHSIPLFLEEQRDLHIGNCSSDATAMREATIPLLGLNAVSPRSLPEWDVGDDELQVIHEILPGKDEILASVACYRNMVHPLNPVLVDIDGFELKLSSHLDDTLVSDAHLQQLQIWKKDLHWAALFFAVLAAGLQMSNTNRTESSLKCRQYISLAYKCLTLTHGFIVPSLSSVQTFVVLVYVLQNELYTEAAWTILGLISRQAQSLGFHVTQLREKQDDTETMQKSKLWSLIVWQDTLLSTCFGRPLATSIRSTDTYSELILRERPLSYYEAMFAFTNLALLQNSRVYALDALEPSHEEVLLAIDKIEQIKLRLKPEIMNRTASRSLQDQVEYHAWNLHSNFYIGTLLRPSFSSKHWQYLPPPQRQNLNFKCLNACKISLTAYVNLLAISSASRKSWGMLHNGLTAALTLAITGCNKTDTAVARALKRLCQSLESSVSSEDSDPIWGPHQRGLSALRKFLDSQPHDDASNVQANTASLPLDDKTSDDTLLSANGSNTPPEVSNIEMPHPCESNNPGHFSFDQQAITDFSSFLPEGANAANDLMFDDIFDSVLWGDYGEQMDNSTLNWFG